MQFVLFYYNYYIISFHVCNDFLIFKHYYVILEIK